MNRYEWEIAGKSMNWISAMVAKLRQILLHHSLSLSVQRHTPQKLWSWWWWWPGAPMSVWLLWNCYCLLPVLCLCKMSSQSHQLAIGGPSPQFSVVKKKKKNFFLLHILSPSADALKQKDFVMWPLKQRNYELVKTNKSHLYQNSSKFWASVKQGNNFIIHGQKNYVHD